MTRHPSRTISELFATEVDLPSPQVEFTLTPIPVGTRLRLVHRGLPPDQAPIHATGWQHFLTRLALAATGQDPGPDPWNQAPVPATDPSH